MPTQNTNTRMKHARERVHTRTHTQLIHTGVTDNLGRGGPVPATQFFSKQGKVKVKLNGSMGNRVSKSKGHKNQGYPVLKPR